jgi:hypothetical protein
MIVDPASARAPTGPACVLSSAPGAGPLPRSPVDPAATTWRPKILWTPTHQFCACLVRTRPLGADPARLERERTGKRPTRHHASRSAPTAPARREAVRFGSVAELQETAEEAPVFFGSLLGDLALLLGEAEQRLDLAEPDLGQVVVAVAPSFLEGPGGRVQADLDLLLELAHARQPLIAGRRRCKSPGGVGVNRREA